MASTVFVWNNNVAGLPSYPGHVSMNIGDIPVRQYNESLIDSFVSWIPSNQVSHSGKDAGYADKNILNDLHYEGYAPDHIIRIPTTPASEDLMRNHWRDLRNKRVPDELDQRLPAERADAAPSYRFKWKNCSRMVQRVLKSGNLSWSLNPFKWNVLRKHVIWTPLDVLDLALSYQGAAKIQWFDWAQGQTLTINEKTLLSYFQRRHARHGSSGATPRNSALVNTRLLHALPWTSSNSGYKNTALKDAMEAFGNPAATVAVRRRIDGVATDPALNWNFGELIRHLNNRDYTYLQN